MEQGTGNGSHDTNSMMAASAGRDDDGADDAPRADGGQRLDKWLWFVRAIKSRTQAAGLVTEGKVRLNRDKATKPSQTVRPGDVLTVNIRGHVRVLRVVAPGERRGPPAEAQTLYEDLTPPMPRRDTADPASPVTIGERDPGSGRPTKRERRQTDRLRRGR